MKLTYLAHIYGLCDHISLRIIGSVLFLREAEIRGWDRKAITWIGLVPVLSVIYYLVFQYFTILLSSWPLYYLLFGHYQGNSGYRWLKQTGFFPYFYQVTRRRGYGNSCSSSITLQSSVPAILMASPKDPMMTTMAPVKITLNGRKTGKE